MSNHLAILRALLIYGICLPLAIYLGYLLASPENQDSQLMVGLVLALLLVPVVLHWHHPLLVFGWNAGAVVFFVKGEPPLWLLMVAISLTVSVFQRALNRGMRFLSAWSLVWPLIFLTVVILVTSQLTGGMGFRAAGSNLYGGKRYFLLFGAVLGFFALISRQIPITKARKYVTIFFISGLTCAISAAVTVVPPGLYWIFRIFPADMFGVQALMNETFTVTQDAFLRLSGLAMAGQSVFCLVLGLFGVRRLFQARQVGWLLLVLLAVIFSLFAGFRTNVIILIATFAMVFWFEGLARTRWLPILLVTSLAVALAALPFVEKMPLPVQRSLSFLPVDISPIADLKKSEVRQMCRELDVLPELAEAVPTDGLWDDNRTDETQLGATYEELEWAMTYAERLEYALLRSPTNLRGFV